MLTVVPDLEPSSGRVQVLGRILVHHSDAETKTLTGSGQRLVAVLVAAGPEGATAERIAQEIWGDAQPNPWRPALRMAIARLRKQLPARWEIVAAGGSYRVATDDGWVDAWQLEAVASSQQRIDEPDLAWMLAGLPFGEIDSQDLVRASGQHLQMLQVTVAERFCEQAPKAMSIASCGLLGALVRQHPYNDVLALDVAQTLEVAGRRTEAILSLTAFAEIYGREFGTVPSEIHRFLSADGAVLEPVDFDEHARSLVDLPAPHVARELRPLIEVPLVGQVDVLRKLRASRGAMVTGVTGVGKSRLLAEIVAETPQIETTYVVGDDRLDLPLGPFAAAVPALRDELLSDDTLASDPEDGSADRAIATRAWRLVLAHLEAKSASRVQRLIIDDAHLLDPASLGLLRLLIRSNTTAEVIFIICGRSDFDDVDWIELVRDAERSGLEPIEVEGLGVADLEEMVFDEFPTATVQARHGLARDVYEASGGLPAVAEPLIALADPSTLALPERLAGTSVLARVTANVAELSSEVVASAAVLGLEFSVGNLIALAETGEDAVFQGLDELWARGLIVETEDPDQLRFRHLLVQRAFLEAIPLFRRGQLHRRAAELTTDPHERADHHANASALVPTEVACESLFTSAKLYAGRRLWRKVARELRRIEDISSGELDAESLTLWAAALDQSGADGSTYRQDAYRLAARDGDWEMAFGAAVSGLPEAELPDGDADRIEMLLGIPADELLEGSRFELVCHLSRQLSLASRYHEGLAFADQALDLAREPDEVARSHILRWTATRHYSESHWIPDEVGKDVSPQILTRLVQIRALNEGEAGDFAQARINSDRFHELAVHTGDPLRLWHAQGMKGMFLLNNAQFEAGEALALSAMQFAELHDMQQGASSFVGLQVYIYDLRDQLAELAPQLEPFRPNLAGLTLGRAALILADHANGKTDIGDQLREIVDQEHARDGNTFSLISQILLARFLLEYVPDLVPETRRVLARHGENPVLAGFGAGSFGPTTRYLAQLAAEPDEKQDLLTRSIAAADRQGPLLWRVYTRLDMAAFGSMEALAQAQELARGTELAPVVDGRAKLMN